MAAKRKGRGLGLGPEEHASEARRALATAARHLRMKGPFSCGAAEDYVIETAEYLGAAKAHMASGNPTDDDKRDLAQAGRAFSALKKAFRSSCVRGSGGFELSGLRSRKPRR